jgi:hypothetical protein
LITRSARSRTRKSHEVALQDRLIAICAEISSVALRT